MYKKNKDEPPKFAPSMPQTFLVLRCYSCGVFQAQTRLGDLTHLAQVPCRPFLHAFPRFVSTHASSVLSCFECSPLPPLTYTRANPHFSVRVPRSKRTSRQSRGHALAHTQAPPPLPTPRWHNRPSSRASRASSAAVSYTHLRAHETG